MKKLSGKKMDEMMSEAAVVSLDVEAHLAKQRTLLENLEDSEEFIGRVESMAHATVTLIKTQGQENAMRALMSGLVEAFCLGVEVGHSCSEEEGFECLGELSVERTN